MKTQEKSFSRLVMTMICDNRRFIMPLVIHFNIVCKIPNKDSIRSHFNKIHFPYKSDGRLQLIDIKRKGFVGRDYNSVYRIKVLVKDVPSKKTYTTPVIFLAKLLADNTFAICSNCMNAIQVSGSFNMMYCPNCKKTGKFI